jgi:hypothetical protein
MTDWYISSAAYATYAAFQTLHTYAVGDIIVPTAPAEKAMWVFRCTTAGLTDVTEPTTWNSTNNAITKSGTATFTNITGQSAYFWQAAAGDIPTLSGRPKRDDLLFVSSDHIESHTGFVSFGGPYKTLCVNRAGSTPPVEADLTTGALLSCPTQLGINNSTNTYFYGITFSLTDDSGSEISIGGGNSGGTIYLKNCQLWLDNAGSTTIGGEATGNTASLIMDNTTVNYGYFGQFFTINYDVSFDLTWINTPNAFSGVAPSILFLGLGGLLRFFGNRFTGTYRGVDLSACYNLFAYGAFGNGHKYLLESCKINPSNNRWRDDQVTGTCDYLELVNCFDGTHYLNEIWSAPGSVTTEFSITLAGGAADDVGAFAHNMTSSLLIDQYVGTLNGFWMDIENLDVGVSKTASVEIISSQTLQNDEVSLHIHYMGTEGSSISSWASSLLNLVINPPSDLPASTATWNSLPDTPVTQVLQVVFTPQKAGRVRGQVRLGIPSTTVFYNPQIILT